MMAVVGSICAPAAMGRNDWKPASLNACTSASALVRAAVKSQPAPATSIGAGITTRTMHQQPRAATLLRGRMTQLQRCPALNRLRCGQGLEWGRAADGPRTLHAMPAGQRQQYGKALMLDERPVPAHCTSGQRQPAGIQQLRCMRTTCSAAFWRRPLAPTHLTSWAFPCGRGAAGGRRQARQPMPEALQVTAGCPRRRRECCMQQHLHQMLLHAAPDQVVKFLHPGEASSACAELSPKDAWVCISSIRGPCPCATYAEAQVGRRLSCRCSEPLCVLRGSENQRKEAFQKFTKLGRVLAVRHIAACASRLRQHCVAH